MDARLGLIFLLSIVSSASASEIVLTAFQPFGGVSPNNSEPVIDRLAVLLRDAAPAGQIKVKECILPVEYDRGAKVAIDCIADQIPDVVLSFGTGGCDLSFETLAHNRDNTWSPDNARVLRNQNTQIIPGSQEVLALSAPMTELFRNIPHRGSLGRLSTSAGAYVCNNTAYWLAHHFEVPGSPTRFGFIHVPPVTCSKVTSDPDNLAEMIFVAMRGAMPELF